MGVSEPVADGTDVAAPSDEVHGRGVAHDVGSDGFGLDGRAFAFGPLSVFFEDVADAKAGDGCALGIQEECLFIKVFGSADLD